MIRESVPLGLQKTLMPSPCPLPRPLLLLLRILLLLQLFSVVIVTVFDLLFDIGVPVSAAVLLLWRQQLRCHQ